MKISLNWIKQFTEVNLPIDKLVEKIGAQLGAVEEVVDLGALYKGIVVAKVVTCERHSGADKLHVCTVDDGGKASGVTRDNNGHVQVVCGAPNVRAGMMVAWLPPGVTVPVTATKDPFVIEVKEIRGEVSNGMLASAHELAVSDNHDGLLELDAALTPGTDFAKAYELDDFVIDIENKMFTHRPDLFGQLGVAREIAGISGQKFTSPDWYLKTLAIMSNTSENQSEFTIKNSVSNLVPRFMAVAINDVVVAPSPIWLQSYLTRVGIRPINNIVDATNYIMMLTAQPLHAYDADKLPSKKSRNQNV